jgi:carbohydrate diacid regulator
MPLRLSAGLAQRIVDRISPIINYNVNIMDPTGLVVAAVDATRVGGLHEGAREAAESEAPVIVYQDDPERGVQQGVNLPFRDGEDVLGVVGITGPPKRVEVITQLVLALVELIVTGEREQGAAEVQAVRDRDFLVRLVHESHQLGNNSFDAELERIPKPWQLTAYVPLRARSAEASLNVGLHQLELMAGKDRGVKVRVAQFLGALWTLTSVTSPDRETVPQGADQADWHRLFVRLKTAPCSTPDNLGAQVRILRALVEKPGLLPNKSFLHIPDLFVEAALTSARPELLRALATPLRDMDARYLGTLEAFTRTNGNITQTSRLLGIHRNSVMNQLEKIADISGFDPRDGTQLQGLLIALVAHRGVT